MSGPKDATGPVTTVEKLWKRSRGAARAGLLPDRLDLFVALGDGETKGMTLTILALGQHLSHEIAMASARGPEQSWKEPE